MVLMISLRMKRVYEWPNVRMKLAYSLARLRDMAQPLSMHVSFGHSVIHRLTMSPKMVRIVLRTSFLQILVQPPGVVGSR